MTDQQTSEPVPTSGTGTDDSTLLAAAEARSEQQVEEALSLANKFAAIGPLPGSPTALMVALAAEVRRLRADLETSNRKHESLQRKRESLGLRLRAAVGESRKLRAELDEAREALRASRTALDAAMQYVAPKDRDWIERLARGEEAET